MLDLLYVKHDRDNVKNEKSNLERKHKQWLLPHTAEQQEVNVGPLESESCRNNVTHVDQVQTLGTSCGSRFDDQLCCIWLKVSLLKGNWSSKPTECFLSLIQLTQQTVSSERTDGRKRFALICH